MVHIGWSMDPVQVVVHGLGVSEMYTPQNITVSEDGSFQVKFPNVFTNYPLGAVRVEDQRFIDWDHYKFTLLQTQLNFAVFCAISACGVSVEHMNAKKLMIRSIYRFHVYKIILEGY